MANIRSQNEIIQSLLEVLRGAQPNLDTKPGTVSRDLCVDSIASQLGRLYQELERISSLQSLRLAVGSDLDKLAANYGATRKTGAKSSGKALLTFSELETDIPVNKSDLVYARNGASFIINTGFVISAASANTYRSIASQYRADLDLIGNTDEFAVELTVQALVSGIQGNISKYNLISSNITGISHVTNVVSFSGGTQAEDDAAFRSRVLAIFSGANTGTSLGYKNAVLADPSVLDALVIEPGDDLMTRDGTQVYVSESGTRTIISEGTGGKVDVLIFGTRLQENVESYIYLDRSNTGDPTNPANAYVLGQIPDDAGKTITRKRLDNITSKTLPNQPINNILSVSGSISGSNFIPKSVDELGRVTGNYELVKDTGAYAGSAWGFDKLNWVSDRISNLYEDKTKGTYNGQDSLSFTDMTQVSAAYQRISVVNENSRVNKTNRSSIQLSHAPITNVTRVLNATTGERYVVASQNPDGTGDQNLTGRITITGSTLPAVSDTLQVDYTWIKPYDPEIDFDGKQGNLNPNVREVSDSVDWGYSNAVRREAATTVAYGDGYTVTVTHPISAVLSVNTTDGYTGVVSSLNDRAVVIVDTVIENVVSVIRQEDLADLWNTSQKNGSFSGSVIFLPTDYPTLTGINNVIVTYNAVDIYNEDGYEGSFNSNIISIVANPGVVSAGLSVEVNYISNVSTLVPATVLSQLPLIRNSNTFNSTTQTGYGTQPTTHVFVVEPSPYGNPINDISQNLRQAPSSLGFSISGSISPGVFTVAGTTLHKVTDALVTQGSGGLTIELSSVIKSELGLTSAGTVPSNLKLARITKVQKVTATGAEVLSIDNTYDVNSYKIKDNSFFKSESVEDSSLSATQFVLPETYDNQANEPEIGTRLLVTFYYMLENDSENVYFSKSGTLYTNSIFAIVNTISIASGFSSGSSQTATLTILTANQPNTGTRYQAVYDYLAPKSNERISIRFNTNRLIADTQLLIENTRPVTADVLSKSSTAIYIDATLNIVLYSDYNKNANTVKQNVQDAIINALNANALNTTIDSSDLVVVAQGVAGVDRARVIYFNKADQIGSVLSITAQKNEYLQANSVIVNIETR